MKSAAVLSPDGVYRYSLSRAWGNEEPRLCFVMLNPSTADGTADDPTIRKCIGFGVRHGFGAITVVNLFAYRATDPRDLVRARSSGVDVVGPENLNAVIEALRDAKRVICAWGACSGVDLQKRAADVLEVIRFGRHTPMCLGLTKTGQPRHPLMLPYAAELQPFQLQQEAA